MPNPDFHILDKISALNACGTLDTGSVRDILDVTLTLNEEQSTRFFSIYAGGPRDPARSPIARVELRVAKAGERSRGEFLYFKLTEESAVSRSELTQKFGLPPKLDVPTPENSLEYAVRYVYQFNKYPVSFALTAEPNARVVSIAFDRTE